MSADRTFLSNGRTLHSRFLPHWQPRDNWIFITWRLAGSRPSIPEVLTADLPEGKRFALLDQEADRATSGPLWLADPRIARVVQDKIISGTPDLYDLAAWVIMANHVHIVILPKGPVRTIIQTIKGSTARMPTKFSGEPVGLSGTSNPTTTGFAPTTNSTT